jgi:hypothetical protein
MASEIEIRLLRRGTGEAADRDFAEHASEDIAELLSDLDDANRCYNEADTERAGLTRQLNWMTSACGELSDVLVAINDLGSLFRLVEQDRVKLEINELRAYSNLCYEKRLMSFRLDELKNFAARYGLDVSGQKKELAHRIAWKGPSR